MKKPCNCLPPPPPPQKGPSEYIPSRTYPDQFDYMMYGGAPMHRGMGPWIPAGPCGCCPPGPEPKPEPDGSCPPKIYRNPPDVEIDPGQNITVERYEGNTVYHYTINAVQFPVVIDTESEDVLYGDGRPENPIGVYDFSGATSVADGKAGAVPAPEISDRDKFLKGNGEWADVENSRECTALEMDDWLDEVQ